MQTEWNSLETGKMYLYGMMEKKYISDQTSLPPELIERLVHETDPNLRKMLENNLPPANPVLSEISTKFTFETKNGLKILK